MVIFLIAREDRGPVSGATTAETVSLDLDAEGAQVVKGVIKASRAPLRCEIGVLLDSSMMRREIVNFS